MDPTAILEIAALLYRSNTHPSIKISELYDLASPRGIEEVDEIVSALAERKLLRLSLSREIAYLVLSGKVAYEDGSLLALIFGTRYIVDLYRGAVVHIIVSGSEGESGATGFFSADFPNTIVTAAHVVQDRAVIRVEDCSRKTIRDAGFEVVAGPPSLDIALIRCQMPEDVKPIQIEWRPEMIQELDHVLILGYPPFPRHQPALFHAVAEVHAIAKDYGGGREKLIVSSITRPGCSGGPVISERGFAVGVIEQENMSQTGNQTYSFFSATMAHFVRELAPRRNETGQDGM
jgi:S1-C subfamily serine protease